MSTNTLVFGLFEYDAETDGNLPFNITQALNNNWNKIDSLVLPSAAVAAPYNPSGTYNVGDYCIYNGTLQKCNTPIPSGEPWNATHWTETTVAAELANRVSRAGELVPLGTNILTLAPGRYCVDGVPDTDTANSMNLPVTTWHYEIDVIAAENKTGLIGNYKVISVYPSSTVVLPYINIMNYEGEWTGWTRIPTATPPQERNLTLQSGFTANGDCTFFVTQESAVFLAGGVSGTLPANQDTQIGTLPADVSPAAQRRRPAVTNAGAAYIDIHTDGTVWAHPFAVASQCWFDTSFVAGGGS